MPEDTLPEKTATEEGKTLGDLVSALREAIEHPEDLALLGAGFWIDDLQREAGGGWDQAMQWPLNEEGVMALVQLLVDEIAYEVQGRGDQESYDDARNRGHAFLKLIHVKATDLGVDIPLEQIDTPFTPTEMMVQAGMVKEVDGRVHLTDEGHAAAQQVQDQIDALKE